MTKKLLCVDFIRIFSSNCTIQGSWLWLLLLSGLKQKEILWFVSRNIGYFVFFAIALSLYQDGSTCLCWQIGFYTMCCMQRYCKTNGVLNKILFPLSKKPLCLRHYYFLWWPAVEVPSRVLVLLKPHLVSALQNKEQAKAPAGAAASQRRRKNGDLNFEA